LVRRAEVVPPAPPGETGGLPNAAAKRSSKETLRPLDGHSFTALYSHRGTVAVYDGHMENPTLLIEHAPGVAVAGDEPCIWIAPRLEDKQFKISDPDDELLTRQVRH
jgi:hypothetical protein